ncbi:MAG: MBL fold metallo-hydrolase [bacterium]
MKVQIVYDNHENPGFKSGWGFSCYLPELKLLFDTGWDARRLLYNMDRLEIDPGEIEKVVISHSHWDHAGGLPGILKPGMDIYVPTSFSDHMKGEIKKIASLHEISGTEEILPGMYSSGELGEEIKEQALAVETEEGLLVLTGCAHPGVTNIFKAFKPLGNIQGLVGGLHGFDNYPLLEGLKLIAASHCTKHMDEIAQKFPDTYEPAPVGKKIIF